jgi:hypothetical protein
MTSKLVSMIRPCLYPFQSRLWSGLALYLDNLCEIDERFVIFTLIPMRHAMKLSPSSMPDLMAIQSWLQAAGPTSLARKRQSRETGSRHWRLHVCVCACDSLVDEGLRGRATSHVVRTWRWISCTSWHHFDDTVALKRNKCVSFLGSWIGLAFISWFVLLWKWYGELPKVTVCSQSLSRIPFNP